MSNNSQPMNQSRNNVKRQFNRTRESRFTGTPSLAAKKVLELQNLCATIDLQNAPAEVKHECDQAPLRGKRIAMNNARNTKNEQNRLDRALDLVTNYINQPVTGGRRKSRRKSRKARKSRRSRR